MLALDKTLDLHREHVQNLEAQLLAESFPGPLDPADIPIQLDDARAKCLSIEKCIRQKKAALGVNELANLAKLADSPFLRIRMNARALKKRIRERLRHRKFELEKLERSYRRSVNGWLLLISFHSRKDSNIQSRPQNTESHGIFNQKT